MSVTPIDPLEKLRQSLTTGQRKAIRAVINQAERELIDAWPELTEGARSSARQGSWTVTLDLKAAKHDGHFLGKLNPRVRVPKEPTEFDFHEADNGQLELGLPKGWDDGGGQAAEGGD
jgi:hypothetical protein